MPSVHYPYFSPCKSKNTAAEHLVAVSTTWSIPFPFINIKSKDSSSPNFKFFFHGRAALNLIGDRPKCWQFSQEITIFWRFFAVSLSTSLGLVGFNKFISLSFVGWEKPLCTITSSCLVERIVSLSQSSFTHSICGHHFFLDQPLISNVGGIICLVPYWHISYIWSWYRS